MIWLVPRLWGVLPTLWHFRADATTRLICSMCVCLCFHVCFVVNPPVPLCTVCYRGQSKECKRVGQLGHQRANQSVMDFPVKDTQLGSPSLSCRSQLEVFLGLSVSKVVKALCTMNLKLQNCQKHSISPHKEILKSWYVYFSSHSHFCLSQLKIHFLKRHLALSVIWQDFCKKKTKKAGLL